MASQSELLDNIARGSTYLILLLFAFFALTRYLLRTYGSRLLALAAKLKPAFLVFLDLLLISISLYCIYSATAIMVRSELDGDFEDIGKAFSVTDELLGIGCKTVMAMVVLRCVTEGVVPASMVELCGCVDEWYVGPIGLKCSEIKRSLVGAASKVLGLFSRASSSSAILAEKTTESSDTADAETPQNLTGD